ncbi:hypothetical protein JOD45_000214 [Scopulibacillus daqui]|uniref:Uncharacterized protein n=1 Tax=Scopulibacillus daqui TaxID=1469162 RepID=A0ABS2PVD9_9BACL|nr:hypothetical protein [Scopulibacillus daqui]
MCVKLTFAPFYNPLLIIKSIANYRHELALSKIKIENINYDKCRRVVEWVDICYNDLVICS